MNKHGLVPEDYWCEGTRCHYTEAGCGCVIHDCDDEPDVEYCSLHAQAEGIRALLARAVKYHDALWDDTPAPAWCNEARALLRAVEGK